MPCILIAAPQFIYNIITQRYNCERKYCNHFFILPSCRLFILFRGSVVHLILFPNTELGCDGLREGRGESRWRLNIVMSVSHRRWTMTSSIGPTLIVLQRTFYQLQFWCLCLYILYNTTYSDRITLTGHCTYSRSQKYIICIQALPVKCFIRSVFLSA